MAQEHLDEEEAEELLTHRELAILLGKKDPTTIRDFGYYVKTEGPHYDPINDHDTLYGKWLVFRPYEQLDEMWRTIREKIESGELGSPCAYCSALYYNPHDAGPGPARAGLIAVYSTRETIDEVGMKLIPLVKNDIPYKTDEATSLGVYKHRGAKRTTIKTLFWNDGSPSFEWPGKGKSNRGPQPDLTKEDPWKLNVAKSPEPFISEEVFGKWIVTVGYDDINDLWHLLREMVESGELEAKEMVCPSKRDVQDPNELPEFHIFTSETRKDSVGVKLKQIHLDDSDESLDLRYQAKFEVDPYIRCKAPEPLASEEEHGKWVIKTDYDKLHELWSTLGDKVKSGELGAKEMFRPLPKQHPHENPQIHVLTSQCQERIDEMGLKLIHIVKGDIVYYYKPQDDQLTGPRNPNEGASHRQSAKYRILCWNDGEPAYKIIPPSFPKNKPGIKLDGDIQMKIQAPEPLASEEEHGKWVIELNDYRKLRELWSTLSDKVRSGELGAKEMVRPPKPQHSRGNPQIHVFTSQRRVNQVGFKLIRIVKQDIVYKPLENPWTSWRDQKRGGKGRGPHFSNICTLYWNNGESDYDIVRRPGITRNWRTGEEK